MDGVVVVETFNQVTKYVSEFSTETAIAGGAFGLIVGIAICLMISIKTKYEPSRPFVGMFAMFVAIGIGYLSGWIVSEKIPVETEVHYIVELTEELDYKEFIEQYEVLEYEDGRYIIRERD